MVNYVTIGVDWTNIGTKLIVWSAAARSFEVIFNLKDIFFW
jgi:hypothetical protein